MNDKSTLGVVSACVLLAVFAMPAQADLLTFMEVDSILVWSPIKKSKNVSLMKKSCYLHTNRGNN